MTVDRHSDSDSQYDTGYAWVTLVASFLTQIITAGIAFNVGIFYLMFMENIPASRLELAAVTSVLTALHYLTGEIANGVYSYRLYFNN